MPDLAALTRHAVKVLPEGELQRKLAEGRPLRVKLGIDPTARDIHVGNAIPLQRMRAFQEQGHTGVLIIGDYTARVGDPSGRSKERRILSDEQIDANARAYFEQASRILDPDRTELRFNSEWLAPLDFAEILRLTRVITVSRLLERNDFAQRFAAQKPISVSEFLYPLMQGYDSVMIDSDVEMGGSDQLFNNLVGRDLQEEAGKPGQAVIVTPLLVGTDGVKKMSKSQKNYIAVLDRPSGQEGMFGKVMSLPDALMESYYTLLTDIATGEFRDAIKNNPRDAKVALAKHVISWLHNPEAAGAAEEEFNRLFRKKDTDAIPDDTPTVPLGEMGPGPHRLPPLLVKAGLAASNSEATRKIREGAVAVNGEKVTDVQQVVTVAGPTVLKLGRKYARVTP